MMKRRARKVDRRIRDSAMLRLRFAHRRSRLFRWSLRLLVLIPLTLLLAVIVVTQTRVARTLVLPIAESLTGLEFDADSVRMTTRGTLVLDKVRVRIPGVEGPAGEFASAARIEVVPSWGGALTGSMSASRIRLESPTIRVSQSTGESKSLNIASLTLPAADAGAPSRLPEIDITDGSLELGEHTAENYRTLKRLRVKGGLRPAADKAGEYILSLEELRVPGSRPGGIAVSGRITPTGVEAEMIGVSLDEWGPETVPSAIRGVVEQLNLKGKIAQTVVKLDRGVLVGPVLILENIETTLPVPAESGESEPLRMTGVSGKIEFLPDGFSAALSGFVRDLPYAVDLKYHGFDATAPFECTLESRGFFLERNPQLLPWLPKLVREQLVRFRSPSARVNAIARVNRLRAPDGSNSFDVSGEVSFTDGRASYDSFPYAFHGMSGTIVFGNDRAEVVRIEGTAPSGAHLVAHAVVEPLDDDPNMVVDVHVTGVPVDAALLAGMSGGKADLVRALLLNGHFDAMRARGIIPEAFRNDVPVSVNIHLVRVPNRVRHWDQDITVTADRLRIVPEWFPVPVVGEDVRLRITDSTIDVVDGKFSGLGASRAEIDATIAHGGRDGSDRDLRPDINVAVDDVRIDHQLLYALEQRRLRLPDGRETNVADLLKELGVTGTLGARVRVLSRDDGRVGFEASVDLAGAALSPTVCDVREVRWKAVGGRVDIDENGVTLNVTADSVCVDAGLERPNGPVTITGRLDAPMTHETHDPDNPNAPPETPAVGVSLRIDANSLDLRSPVETLAGVFSTDAQRQLTDMRSKFNPTGRASLVVTIDGEPGHEPVTRVRLGTAEHVGVDFFGKRCTVVSTRGVAEFEVKPPIVRLSGFSAELLCEGVPAGTLAADGTIRVEEAGPDFVHPDTSAVLRLTASQFENPLTDGAIATSAGPAFTDLWRTFAPSGVYDATISLGPVHAKDGVSTVLRPRTWQFTQRGERIDLGDLSGEISFTKAGGTFESLRCASGDIAGVFAGWWRVAGDNDFSYSISGEASAPGFTAQVRALIPERGTGLIDGLKLVTERPITVRDMIVNYSRSGPTDDDIASSFRGDIDFEDLSVLVGVQIDDAAGSCRLEVEGIPGVKWPIVRLDALTSSMSVVGLRATDGQCRLENAGEDGVYRVEQISCDLYGGRVAGDGWLHAHEDPPVINYFTRLKCADVRFNPVLIDMTAYRTSLEGVQDGEPTPPGDPEDRTRGVLDATLALGGIVGNEPSKRGRGELRVSGGKVVEMPLVLPLLEVSNLQMPVGSELDLAIVSFGLQGDVIIIEDASIVSQSVWIYGLGSLAWPSLELDMHFFSRSARAIPLVSAILEGIRNEVVSTRVTGTLGKPAVRLQGFRDAQRLLGDVIGQKLSESERRVESVLNERSDIRRTPGYDPIRVRPSAEASEQP